MGGFFGTVSKASCVTDLFYGTDYNSHLGTKRGGLATYSKEKGFIRSIHNLESTYFRTKFEGELDKFKGNAGIGIISDTDAQPIIINSHLGRFAIITVAKVVNIQQLEDELLNQNMHFAELSSSNTNQTELIALLLIQGRNFVEGIENVFKHIKGSCSMLILTEDGSIIAARDQWGRTPIVIGKKEGAYAATSESSSFPNLDYEIEKYLGPGEIVRMYDDHIEQLREPAKATQDATYIKAVNQMRDFLIRIQVRSDKFKSIDGAWFRAFNYEDWNYWASNADAGWGVWSTLTGWIQSWIVGTQFVLEEDSSLWDIANQKDVSTVATKVIEEMITRQL